MDFLPGVGGSGGSGGVGGHVVGDTEHAVAVGDRVETGTVFMNRCDYLDPALVWTGVKDTGKGAGLSQIGYDNLTRPKSYHLRKL